MCVGENWGRVRLDDIQASSSPIIQSNPEQLPDYLSTDARYIDQRVFRGEQKKLAANPVLQLWRRWYFCISPFRRVIQPVAHFTDTNVTIEGKWHVSSPDFEPYRIVRYKYCGNGRDRKFLSAAFTVRSLLHQKARTVLRLFSEWRSVDASTDISILQPNIPLSDMPNHFDWLLAVAQTNDSAYTIGIFSQASSGRQL